MLIPSKTQPADSRAKGLMYVLIGACLILLAVNGVYLKTKGLRLKTTLVSAASSGFSKIADAATALNNTNFENAKRLFSEAQATFENMQAQTWFASPKFPAFAMRDPLFETSSAVIAAGKHLSKAGAIFTETAAHLQSLPRIFFEANVKETALQGRPSLTEKLKKQIPAILATADSLNKANEEIQKIPESFIPASLKERFSFAKEALGAVSGFVGSLQEDTPAILSLLGDKEPHTFLILLQNNAELRPSGGFIGNYMITETNDGYITKNEVFDIYSADHQLTEIISPPPEILPANKRWFMRDSNYSGHFPLSAAKAAWFLEKENGPGVDSVIAIDQSFVKELLRLSGPVKIPELSMPLNAQNFSVVLSYVVESKLTGRENPKIILKSLIPALQKALLERADPVALAALLRSAAQSKHLLMYSKNPAVQAFFERRGFAGEMKNLEPKEDYLNIVNTSIGANKSDDYITETIIHDTYLKSDGSIIDEVTVARTHEWNFATEKRVRTLLESFGFSEIPDKIWRILGKGTNLHMLRIYVPQGSILEENAAKNITTHIDQETGKTYFSTAIETPLNTMRSIKIRYKLPFKLNLDPVDKYMLTVQKQAGQDNITFRKRIFPDSRVLNYKYFPADAAFDIDGVWNFETPLASDMTLASVWGK